jgi:hypothetical protein
VRDTSLVPIVASAERPGEVSVATARTDDPAAWQGYEGVAARTRQARCVLGRHRPGGDPRPETWVRSADDLPPGSCTGRLALEGPDAPLPLTGGTTPEASLAVPAGLRAVRGDHSITLSWDPVAGASGYDVHVDGAHSQLVLGTSVSFTNLPVGASLSFRVMAAATDGRRSPLTAPPTIDVRPGGPWDAQLAWAYDNNAVWWGGASSWSYQVLVSVPAGDDTTGAYRIHLAVPNDGGVVVDGPLLVSRTDAHPADPHGTGLVGTDPLRPAEARICAPEGNPEPPFSQAWVSLERTGEPVLLGLTEATDLTETQIYRWADGTVPVPTVPKR